MATARDYELVAASIKDVVDKARSDAGLIPPHLTETVERIADRFLVQNSRFKPVQFRKACGITQDDLDRLDNLEWMRDQMSKHGHGGI